MINVQKHVTDGLRKIDETPWYANLTKETHTPAVDFMVFNQVSQGISRRIIEAVTARNVIRDVIMTKIQRSIELKPSELFG